MYNSTKLKDSTVGYDRILFTGLFATLCIAFMITTSFAQSATPSPTPGYNDDNTWNGYKVTSTTEFGYRFRSVSGSELKYKSDLNYDKGLRVFDSNIYMVAESGHGKYFDSLLISNSGWGADPNGFTRVNMSKAGVYKFNATVRRLSYFNNLSNHILGEHTSDTKNTMGDFDMTFNPESQRLRVSVGASFGNYAGPGTWTARQYSDEFAVTYLAKQKTNDFRFGVDGSLAGFNINFSQGFNFYREGSSYSTTGNVGNNPTNFPVMSSFYRTFPTNGDSYYSQLSLHRTIAKNFDFTARAIYSFTKSDSLQSENTVGRDNSNNFVDSDVYTIGSKANRNEFRGDVGFTWNISDKFRLSDTFSIDHFSTSGDMTSNENTIYRNAANTTTTNKIVDGSYWRINKYKRYVNTVEGDYQFNNSIAFHIGYRYTQRTVFSAGYDAPSVTRTTVNPAGTTTVSTGSAAIDLGEPDNNNTSAIIAGMKIKPTKNWVIFWDVEQGTADNVFSKVENFKYFNFRVRTRLTVKKFSFNASAISKDNTNPTETLIAPIINLGTNVKHRYYSASLDYEPISQLTFSAGYTYHHLTAVTNTRVNIGVLTPGVSQFFMRDHYGYLDISARPHKRVSLYASYRISRDLGQENRTAVLPSFTTSYPMQFTSPEVRIAFHLTRNVDWNVGYQYYNYHDSQTPSLNYKASLPFTSLRIYFGNGSADR